MCGRFTGLSAQETADVARGIARDARARQLVLPLATDEAVAVHLAPAPLERRAAQGSLFGEAERPADVFPDGVAPVIAVGARSLKVVGLRWGFHVDWQQGPIFNARSEKAGQGMWADACAHRRCVVGAHAFYERGTVVHEGLPAAQQPRGLYRFAAPDGAPLFMAGLYERGRFTLLTCPPNETVAVVHDRMPVLLDRARLVDWLAGDTSLLDTPRLPLVRA